MTHTSTALGLVVQSTVYVHVYIYVCYAHMYIAVALKVDLSCSHDLYTQIHPTHLHFTV